VGLVGADDGRATLRGCRSREDWTAIWFAGQLAWFPDPGHGIGLTAAARRSPRPRSRNRFPVFGTAYPERHAFPPAFDPDYIVPLKYRIPAGNNTSRWRSIVRTTTRPALRPVTSGLRGR